MVLTEQTADIAFKHYQQRAYVRDERAIALSWQLARQYSRPSGLRASPFPTAARFMRSVLSTMGKGSFESMFVAWSVNGQRRSPIVYDYIANEQHCFVSRLEPKLTHPSFQTCQSETQDLFLYLLTELCPHQVGRCSLPPPTVFQLGRPQEAPIQLVHLSLNSRKPRHDRFPTNTRGRT